MLPLSLTIALRFLLSSRREKPLLLFVIVTVAGIAIAGCLFFSVDTLVSGFSDRMKEIMIGFHAPVVVESTHQKGVHDRQMLQALQDRGPLRHVRFFSGREFFGLLHDPQGEIMGIKVRSVPEDFFAMAPGRVKIYWQEGFDEKSFSTSSHAVLIGEELYRNLPWPEDSQDVIDLIHPFADLGPSGELESRRKNFVIAGFISTGSYDIDHLYVFLPEPALSDFGNPDLMQLRFFLYPEKLEQTPALVTALTVVGGFDRENVRTWVEQNKNLFQAMALEKVVFLFLFFVIVVISVVNLVSVVRLFGLSKRRELAVFRALGMGHSDLVCVCLWLGGILSALGAALGVILGAVILLVVRTTGFVLPEAYGHQDVPLLVRWSTVVLLILLTPLVGAVVSYWPIRRSIKRNVIEEFSLA